MEVGGGFDVGSDSRSLAHAASCNISGFLIVNPASDGKMLCAAGLGFLGLDRSFIDVIPLVSSYCFQTEVVLGNILCFLSCLGQPLLLLLCSCTP